MNPNNAANAAEDPGWFLTGTDLDSLEFSPNLLAALGFNFSMMNNLGEFEQFVGVGVEENHSSMNVNGQGSNAASSSSRLQSLLETDSDINNNHNSSPSSSEEEENVEINNENGNNNNIACVRCRKMHKYCSRTKPSCERCSARGIPCEYRESKRKHKSDENSRKKTKATPDETSHPTFFQKLPTSFTKSFIIDFYYAINWFLTIVDREDLRKFILLEKEETETELKLEMESFYFSAKSLVEQFLGKGQVSNETALNCRKKLALINKVPSLIVSSTYLNLASVEIGNGNLQLCNFYLNSAKFYFTSKTEKERLEMTSEEQTLLKALGMIEHAVVFHTDLDLSIRNIPKLYEFASGTFLPQYVSSLFQQSITLLNYDEMITVSESLCNEVVELAKKMIANKKTPNKKHYLDGLIFTKDIFFNGIRIGILARAATGKEMIEESSLKISHLTGNIFFSATSALLIPYFILAARVNLQIAKSIQAGLRVNNQVGIGPEGNLMKIDYFEIVSKDLKALTLLGKRFKIVELQHDKLLQSLKEIVNLREPSFTNSV